MFPGRRGAGQIFHTQVRASGAIPQVCALFGPSAAGGAYIPAFCDFVAMVDGNASMYLGSPRMVEMVVTGADHAGGDGRRPDALHRLRLRAPPGAHRARRAGRGPPLPVLPAGQLAAARRPRPRPRPGAGRPARAGPGQRAAGLRHARATSAGWWTRVRSSRSTSCGRGSWSTGFARLDGQVIGVVANNPMFKGGVLFVDSADKATRFIQLCDAFNIAAAVPGRRARLHGRHRRGEGRASSGTARR